MKRGRPALATLWAVRARSIYRKSRADEGKLGVWLVLAADASAAETTWRASDGVDTWTFESAAPHHRGDCVRVL